MKMSQLYSLSNKTIALVLILALVVAIDAKFLRGPRIFEDSMGGYDSSYAGSTGERAIMTIRGTKNPYDGSAPSKLAIEDNQYRGPYPRGIYNRLDSGYGRNFRMPLYPSRDYGYGSPYGNGYEVNSMFGAPSRIAVTNTFPYGRGAGFV